MPTTDDGLQWVRDQLTQLQSQPAPTMATASPNDGTRPGWTGLLGEVLGGGQTPGYQLRGHEADTAGNRALLNFGIQTLLASGPSPVRPDVFSAVASGLQGAQQSMDLDQRRSMALAQQDYTQRADAWKQKLEGIRAAVPLLTLLQQQQKTNALQNIPSPFAPGPAAGGGDGLTGDKAHDLPLIAQRESGGNPTKLNYVATEDPTAYDRGATASGKYQIVNSTWQEGMRLAGIDPSKYATARDAPEAVQDQVAGALFDKHGNAPWQKGAKDWVKDEQGRYQLATVRPPAGAPGGTTTTPSAATAPSKTEGDPTKPQLVPPPPGGAPGAPATYTGGGIGAVLGGAPPPPAPSDRTANARATGDALLAAKQTGKAVPIAGGNGLVANPDGTVGPPGGGFRTPPSAAKVSSNVDAIQGGMQLAQAQRGQDGSVLAAGPAAPTGGFTGGATSYGGGTTTPPAAAVPQAPTQAQQPPAPGAAVTTPPIPRSTPDAVPDTFEEYQNQHPIIPSDEDRQSFSTDPDAKQLAVLEQQKRIFKYGMQVAQATGDSAGLTKATEAYNTVLAQENTMREAAAKAGADRRAAFLKDQGANQYNAWHDAMAEKQKRITQQQQDDAASALERLRGDEARKTENVKAENVYVGKERERFGVDRDGARASIDSLQMLRALSDKAGTSTPLDNIVVGNMTGRDFMANLHLGTQAQQEKWGAQQAFTAAKNQMVIELRKGIQMGALSDRDMSFLQAMGPELLQAPETRASILQLLEAAQVRKLRYMDSVEELHDGGMAWGKAKRVADEKLGPMITEVPKEYSTWSGQQKQQFFKDHIPPRSVYRTSDGDLAVAP